MATNVPWRWGMELFKGYSSSWRCKRCPTKKKCKKDQIQYLFLRTEWWCLVQNDRGQLEDFSNDNFLMASWSRQTKYQWQWQKILLVLPLVNLTLDLSDSWIYKSLALLEDLSRLKLFNLAVPSDSFISVTFKSFGSGHKWQSK